MRPEQTSADVPTKKKADGRRSAAGTTAEKSQESNKSQKSQKPQKKQDAAPRSITPVTPDMTLTEMNVPTVEFVIPEKLEKALPASTQTIHAQTPAAIHRSPSPQGKPARSGTQRPPAQRKKQQAPPRGKIHQTDDASAQSTKEAAKVVYSATKPHSSAGSAAVPVPRTQRSEAAVHSRPAAQRAMPRSSVESNVARLYAMPGDADFHESTMHRERAERKIPVVPIIAAVLMVVAIIFLILFFRVYFSYEESRQSYQKLNEQLTWTQDAPDGTPDAPSQLDFNALLALNTDTVAWLSMPGIEISLPVVRNEDTAYYLTHGFDGTSNHNGCLFLPGWDTYNWTDGLHHVVYGHNIHDGTMFGRLDSYKDAAFFTSNPEFMIYTPEGDYRCLVFSVRDAIDSDENYIIDWQPGETYDAWLAEMKANSLYDTGVDVPSGSQVITLSTCESTFAANDKRFVVHAVMQKLD